MTDRRHGLEREAAGKDSQARKELLLGHVEQVIAPVDGRTDRLLPCGQIPRPTRQEREAVGNYLGEALEQRPRGQELAAGRRELDG